MRRKPGPSRRFSPSVEELRELYEQYSMSDIAKHYGVGETVVFKRLKEYGIGGISRSARLSGKPKSLRHRLALSESAYSSGIRKGEKNGNWKGGKALAARQARSRQSYFEWRGSVLKRAGGKCEQCGKEHGSICECCGHEVRLQAHHIKSFMENISLRYDPTNGMALCERCHSLEHYKQSRELLETP